MNDKKVDAPLLDGVCTRFTLEPTMGSQAWWQAELARQAVYQSLLARDFSVEGASTTPARQAMAAFATGELESSEKVAEALETMLDPERDPLAMQVKAEGLGIEEPRGMAEVLVELGSYDRELFNDCVSGRFMDAAQRIPMQGYSSPCGTDVWPVEDVIGAIGHLIPYWVLDELHEEARKCRARIFSPTGWGVLDGEFTGIAPLVRPIIAVIQRQLALLEMVAEIYFRDLRTGGCDQEEAASANLLLRVTAQGAYAFKGPKIALRGYGRPATIEETEFLREAGLEALAQNEYDRLRETYGDQLETYIEARMTFVRRKLAQLRAQLDEISSNRRRWMRRAYGRYNLSPHARLWLACEAAVAWTLPARSYEKSPLTRAVEGLRSGQPLGRPTPHRCNVRAVRDLFFALRATTVKDPDHLSDAFREVVLPTGETVVAGNYTNIVRLKGQPISFAEIWAESEARNTHKGREIRSTPFSTEANRFRKAHGVKCSFCLGKVPCPVVDGRWEAVERWLR